MQDPSEGAFAQLLANLPALLPEDPALAAVIADEMAKEFGEQETGNGEQLADSALRAAPPGTSASPGIQDGGVDLRPNRLSTRQRKLQSVQYLTNQKTNRQLQGARPT